MALSPKVIDAMVASGCSVEQLAAAVKADSLEIMEKEAEQRENARQRQRKSRKNKKANEINDRVTVTPVTSRDNCDTPSPSPKKEKSPHTPLKEKITPTPPPQKTTPCGVAKPNRTNGTRLDPNWTLPDEWRKWAIGEGLDRSIVKRQAEQFRDYWCAKSGKDATKLDWFATWRNWIRRDLPAMKRNAKPEWTGAI